MSAGDGWFVTTSWDDGHPLDLRVAEMLAAHGLSGTFYIPRRCDRGVMSDGQIRQIAARFEVGAHTINHVDLVASSEATSAAEISNSRKWLGDVSGREVRMFCPPMGRFAPRHIEQMARAGFVGYRTVEFASIDRPRARGGIRELPTTAQAYPHGAMAYTRNALGRLRVGNLWNFMRYGGGSWVKFMERMLCLARTRGGVVHVWGHSWEIEERDQWGELEEAMRLLQQCGTPCRTNGEVCVG